VGVKSLHFLPPGSSTRRRGGIATRLLWSLIGSVALLFLVNGVIDVTVAWFASEDSGALTEQAHCIHDPDLGWSHEKGRRAENLYGPHRHLTVDSRGFRGLGEIEAEVPPGRYRILCLGDSFTLGFGVDDAETFPAELEKLDPAIESVNMGQGGYGVDQCYLWYRRDGAEIDANLLLLSFIAPDFERMLDDRLHGAFAKPRLEVVAGELRLPRDPVPDDWEAGSGTKRLEGFIEGLAVSDLMKRLRWRAMSNAPPPAERPSLGYEELGEAVVRDLARLARERGSQLALVLLPLQNRWAGHPRELLRWLAPIAEDLGVPLLDLTEDVDRLPLSSVDSYYQADGHLNAHGNRFVAETLRARLRPHFPDLP
jgi:hypothetical protein